MEQETGHDPNLDTLLDHRYQLRREIARGGHGVVFEAEHVISHARVAVKTLTGNALHVPAAHARLLREARVLGVLRHQNVISVRDAGTCPIHGPYLALEMIEGRPLDGILLTRQRLSPGQAVAVTLQLCEALAEVHRHGIVHRDVKPSNVLIAQSANSDRVVLIDFGIAKINSEEDPSVSKLTKAGELLGTVEYMAPEQIMERGVIDERADIYAAGVMLYECLTGEVPYSGAATAVITNMLAGTKPAALNARRSDVPLAFEGVVRRALELAPHKRFAKITELARACRSALGGSVPQLDLLDARGRGNERVASPAQNSQPVVEVVDTTVSAPARRRQYERAPYITPVRVRMGTTATDGRTEDLSEGGLLMVTEAACADGERVTLRLPLPMSGRVVELDATTKWIKTRKNQRAIGAEFIDAPEDVRKEIRAYVALMTDKSAVAPEHGE